MTKKVLLAGESWETFSVHIKGFDTFYTSKYEEGAEWLISALENNGFEVDYLPNHRANSKFPTELNELKQYSAIILSDIGANTLLLHPDTFEKSIPKPNRLKLIREYVKNGGGFLMVGGYISFQGIEAKSNFKGTPIEEILPVIMEKNDDRVEVPEGFNPKQTKEHSILDEVESSWPMLLGYNKFKAKDNAEVLVKHEDDPIVVIGDYHKGRTAAFASDCAPHWGSPEFVEWKDYDEFWSKLVKWITKEI